MEERKEKGEKSLRFSLLTLLTHHRIDFIMQWPKLRRRARQQQSTQLRVSLPNIAIVVILSLFWFLSVFEHVASALPLSSQQPAPGTAETATGSASSLHFAAGGKPRTLTDASAASHAHNAVSWKCGDVHHYAVDTKWWFGEAKGSTVTRDRLERWQPPIGAQDHGVRCSMSIRAVEDGHSGQCNERGEQQQIEEGQHILLLQIHVAHCVPLKSQFGSEYIAMPAPLAPQSLDDGETFDYDDDQSQVELRTPFFVLQSSQGIVTGLRFHTNETLSSRNFKRGLVSFLSFSQSPSVHSLRHHQLQERDHVQQSWIQVDQDEHGM